MPDDRLRDPTATTGSPRLTALALLLTVGATAGLALHPGLALADGPGPSASRPVAARSADGARAAVVPFADDQATADDPLGAEAEDGDVGPDAEDPSSDDGSTLDDDGAADEATDDGDAAAGSDAADDEDAADEPIFAVAIDRRGRAVEGPRSFAARRDARGSRLRWSGWNAATAVGRGTIVVRGPGRAHRALRGSGTVALSRLTVCSDGTPVYRRAVFAVAHRRKVVVPLPGCAALR